MKKKYDYKLLALENRVRLLELATGDLIRFLQHKFPRPADTATVPVAPSSLVEESTK